MRRALRRNQTPAEKRLWRHIRDRRIENTKFRRQYAIDSYIVDFYCPRLKLAIEVDGDSHFIGSGPTHDRQREEHLVGYGIHFLRFTNHDIASNLDGVLDTIRDTILDLGGSDVTHR